MAIWGFIPFSDFIPYSFLCSVENHCGFPQMRWYHDTETVTIIYANLTTLIQLLSESQLEAFGFGGTPLWPNVSCVRSCSTHACSLVGAERLCERPLRPILRVSLCSSALQLPCCWRSCGKLSMLTRSHARCEACWVFNPHRFMSFLLPPAPVSQPPPSLPVLLPRLFSHHKLMSHWLKIFPARL